MAVRAGRSTGRGGRAAAIRAARCGLSRGLRGRLQLLLAGIAIAVCELTAPDPCHRLFQEGEVSSAIEGAQVRQDLEQEVAHVGLGTRQRRPVRRAVEGAAPALAYHVVRSLPARRGRHAAAQWAVSCQ